MINIEISVDIQAAADARAAIERRIEKQLDSALDKLLDKTEQIQILAYTADANPPRPPGSTYVRTFRLQSASKKERGGRTLQNMSGRWSVDLSVARYGREVVGSRSEQDPIHRGRWKSTEEVEEELLEAAPAIIEEELNAI